VQDTTVQLSMTSSCTAATAELCLVVPEIRRLCELAVNGLVSMFDIDSQLFCFRVKRTKHGLVREGFSHRYSIIAFLGLSRLEASGLPSPIDVKRALGSLLRDYHWVDTLGDVGLLLWLCALVSPERIMEVDSRLRVETALNRFQGARQGSTVELAWFLSGLTHASRALPEPLPKLTDLAAKAYHLLIQNQGNQGIFGHLARKNSLAGALRGHLGSFADQVYPIYALTKFAEAYKVHTALDNARRCAEAICRAQGTRGQWWWHYDSSTGRPFERYPVYSVHQHGMGPMALMALGEATRMDVAGSVKRGLSWIEANNELAIDLRDPNANVIWRCIHLNKRCKVQSRRFLSLLRHCPDAESMSNLAVRFECWSYELGWLLYALARRPREE
jgi:hypothetical protein